MTRDEFDNQLMPQLVGSYPTIARWLGKFPAEPIAGQPAQPSQQTILGAWYRTLEPLTLADASAALGALHNGTARQSPSYRELQGGRFDQFPRYVLQEGLRLAKSTKPAKMAKGKR
jgi:hypothetical protein